MHSHRHTHRTATVLSTHSSRADTPPVPPSPPVILHRTYFTTSPTHRLTLIDCAIRRRMMID
jgi:hypothetical protein